MHDFGIWDTDPLVVPVLDVTSMASSSGLSLDVEWVGYTVYSRSPVA